MPVGWVGERRVQGMVVEEQATKEQRTETARAARAAGAVSLAVFASRILGLVRDQFFAKLFGAGLYNDAWLVAFRIPNLLRDLFAEGALSAAFLPTFTEILKKEGSRRAWHLANLVLSALLVLLGLLTLLFLVGAEWLVHALAAGFAEVPGKVELTTSLLRILSPFLLLVAAASVAMGILNAFGHFFLPALAPAVFNVALILSALFLVPAFERAGILPIYAMAAGAVAGGLLQFGVQLPLLRREGFRFRFLWNWDDSGLRRMRRLVGPALIGVSAVQLNVLVNTQLASFLGENGPVSWLSYAFRIMYLPIGLFGVAVGVVNLREVSLHAATARWERLRETLADSVRLVAFLAIPSAVGLMVLAEPIVEVLFERGDFTALDTQRTAWALAAYAVGLLAYSTNKIYVPTFYALDDTRTPVRISLVAVLVNLAANLMLIAVLPPEIRFAGLALGTSISVSVSNGLLSRSLRARLGDFGRGRIRRAMLRQGIAALSMAGVVAGARAAWWPELPPALLQKVLVVGGLVVAGGITYVGACRLLKVEELDEVWAAWKTRGRRG
ncbi:MAG: murein biosynthesis integral membrane protein MurJ [Acidobacteriota bacterium]